MRASTSVVNMKKEHFLASLLARGVPFYVFIELLRMVMHSTTEAIAWHASVYCL